MLNAKLLSEFIDGFYGYGNLEAKLWFVGMEEGGGTAEQEIEARLNSWNVRGGRLVEDVAEFHRSFGQPRWFEPKAPTQRTWRPMIQSILLAKDESCDIESIREYQINKFARKGGEVASLELMPLPSPSIREDNWMYGDWSDLPYLTTRNSYLKAVVPARIKRFKALIEEHKPQAVVFYGAGYQRHWEAISGCDFGSECLPRRAQKKSTAFLLLPHPTARPSGTPPTSGADYFIAAGHVLKDLWNP